MRKFIHAAIAVLISSLSQLTEAQQLTIVGSTTYNVQSDCLTVSSCTSLPMPPGILPQPVNLTVPPPPTNGVLPLSLPPGALGSGYVYDFPVSYQLSSVPLALKTIYDNTLSQWNQGITLSQFAWNGGNDSAWSSRYQFNVSNNSVSQTFQDIRDIAGTLTLGTSTYKVWLYSDFTSMGTVSFATPQDASAYAVTPYQFSDMAGWINSGTANTLDYMYFQKCTPNCVDLIHFVYGSAAVAAVPEPESYGMFLAGLSLLGFLGRRRKLV